MVRSTLFSSIAALSLMAGTAFAGDKQSDSYMIVKDAAGNDAKVVRAQFIRPGDVSPEEYARLLAEADRIRAYQGQPATQSYQPQTFQSQTSQPQTYTQQTQAYTQNVAPLTYNSMTNKEPQTYSEYMAGKRAALARTQAQSAQAHIRAQQGTVYQSPQQPTFQQHSVATANQGYTFTNPQPQAQPQTFIPAPQRATRYQAPNNNRVIYAGMPDVVNGSPAIGTMISSQAGHIVIKGDTLYSLARRYGVSLSALKQVNGLTNNLIGIGQHLLIPGVQTTAQPSVGTQFSAPVSYQSPVTYRPSQPVVTGTIQTHQSQPAGQPYVTRTSASSLSGARVIRAEQPVPPSGVYAVLPDDTIFSVANFACVNAYDVARLNGLTDTTNLIPGQKLNMPSGHCLN